MVALYWTVVVFLVLCGLGLLIEWQVATHKAAKARRKYRENMAKGPPKFEMPEIKLW